jgi:hypothetical protein
MQAVIRDLGQIGQHGLENPGGMTPDHFDGPRAIASDGNALCCRDDRPDNHAFVRLDVRPKDAEWIGVPRFRDRLQQWISFHVCDGSH